MAREVRVAILGDSRDFSRAVRDVQGDAGKLDRTFSKIKGVAAGMGAAFAVGGIARLGASFVSAAEESIKVTKQTSAVLKSMGTASGMTAKKVAALSEKLSLQSGIDDELIQSSQNVLLTFGKVRNEVGKGNQIFDRAAQSALDMSVALGTDLQSATTMLGKALNDPIAGLTALTRAGVQFTDQQKDQIRAMVEAGDTLGAQKIIMEEMERQFSGSAEAQATATDKLRVAWDNIKEQLGEKLLPVVEKVAEWMAKKLPDAMDKVSKWIDETGVPAFKRFRDWFNENITPALAVAAGFIMGTLIPALGKIVSWIAENEAALLGFAVLVGVKIAGAFVAWAAATVLPLWPLWLLVGATAALTAATVWLIEKFNLLPKASQAFNKIIPFITPVIDTVNWLIRRVEFLAHLLDNLPGTGAFPLASEADPSIIDELFPENKSRTARAHGGSVYAGAPYLVGERGPELFMPGASGTIIPNHRLATIGGGGSQTIIVQLGEVEVARVVANAAASGARRGIG